MFYNIEIQVLMSYNFSDIFAPENNKPKCFQSNICGGTKKPILDYFDNGGTVTPLTIIG
jgi:hypothetical protein